MGADGGVCYLRVYDEERFVELTDPFNLLIFDDYIGRNSEWVRENAEEGYCYATYGSFQDISMYDLRQIVGYIEDINSYQPAKGDIDEHWGGLTWREAAWDYKTHPRVKYLRRKRPSHPVLYILHQMIRTLGSEDLLDLPVDSVYDMKMSDWAASLREVCDIDSIQQVETWT